MRLIIFHFICIFVLSFKIFSLEILYRFKEYGHHLIVTSFYKILFCMDMISLWA